MFATDIKKKKKIVLLENSVSNERRKVFNIEIYEMRSNSWATLKSILKYAENANLAKTKLAVTLKTQSSRCIGLTKLWLEVI